MSHAPPSGKDNTLTVPIECPCRPIDESSNVWRKSKTLDQGARERIDHPSKFIDSDCAKNITKHVSNCFGGVFLIEPFGLGIAAWTSDRVTCKTFIAEVIIIVFKSHVYLGRFKWSLSPFNIFWTVLEKWEHDEVKPVKRKSRGRWSMGRHSENEP